MRKFRLFACWILISIALLNASEECCSKQIKESEQLKGQEDVEEKVDEKEKRTEDYKGPVEDKHFLQIKFDEDIWCNEDKVDEISNHFFKYHPNKSPIVLVKPSKVNDDKYYGLLMVDPDAPNKNNPTYADWLHWGLYNIPGDLLKYEALDVIEQAASGYSLMDCFAHYQAPNPPKNSGPHRYHVILTEQKSGALYKEIPQCRNRSNFNTTQFIKNHKMAELVRVTFITENN